MIIFLFFFILVFLFLNKSLINVRSNNEKNSYQTKSTTQNIVSLLAYDLWKSIKGMLSFQTTLIVGMFHKKKNIVHSISFFLFSDTIPIDNTYNGKRNMKKETSLPIFS